MHPLELDDLIERLLTMGREARERHEGMPVMVVWHAEGALVPQLAVIGGLSEDVRGGMDEVLTQIRDTAGPPAWFAVIFDAYAREGDEQSGDSPEVLAEQFAMGDMEIVEQIAVILKQTGQEVMGVRQVYRWTPVDGWEWDEPEVGHDVHDEMSDAVRWFAESRLQP